MLYQATLSSGIHCLTRSTASHKHLTDCMLYRLIQMDGIGVHRRRTRPFQRMLIKGYYKRTIHFHRCRMHDPQNLNAALNHIIFDRICIHYAFIASWSEAYDGNPLSGAAAAPTRAAPKCCRAAAAPNLIPLFQAWCSLSRII